MPHAQTALLVFGAVLFAELGFIRLGRVLDAVVLPARPEAPPVRRRRAGRDLIVGVPCLAIAYACIYALAVAFGWL